MILPYPYEDAGRGIEAVLEGGGEAGQKQEHQEGCDQGDAGSRVPFGDAGC